ncbi:hypothetical protein BH10ACT11_BH10ACT11_05300 [soil metagenome]
MECLEILEEREGWETTSGMVLCSECFASIHGAARAWYAHPPEPTEAKVKQSPMFWLTGPDGEVIETSAFQVVGSGRNH